MTSRASTSTEETESAEAAPTPPGADVMPRSIGGYRISGVLGRGGMGVVYRALAPDGSAVALKVLRGSLADRQAVRRFELEARIPVVHPNVVRVVATGSEAGTPYLALELLEGESLGDRLDRGKLSPSEVVDLGLQVCAGLAAAHARGIVHRDLKPSNLFVCRDGAVKLLDFGIAFWEDEGTRLTRTGSLLGTPAYIAPELVQGQARIDGRADLWSLGVILYEAASGRRPFARDNPMATLLAALVDPHAPLADVAPDVSPELADVIERCLAKDRFQRWPDAGALGEALRDADLSSARPHDGGSDVVRESLPLGERRVVVLLLATDVQEPSILRRALDDRGGAFVPLGRGRVMGLFGLPSWTGDEAVRACEAALDARAAVGSVAVAIGRASQSGGAVAGQVVRTVETGCAAGLAGVALDDETAAVVGARLRVRPARPGLLELLPGASRPSRPPEATELPLVGRRAELAQLETALESLLGERRAQVVVVSGAAGIGKSRLARELERMVEQARSTEPIALLRARAEPHRREDALHVAGTLLRSHAEDTAADECEAPRQLLLRLAREVCDDDDEAKAQADLLAHLPGFAVHQPDRAPTARDPQLSADRLRLSVHDWLASRVALGPMVVVVEQLQWADEASVSLLAELLEDAAERPLLVFATARPELATDPFAAASGLRIAPRGLGLADVSALAASIVGRPLRDALVRAVHARTGGNPLFVEHIVRELAEENRLDVTAGAEAEELPLPLSVEAAVQTRLGQLPVREREVCRLASVFGRAFTPEALVALGCPEPHAALASLEQRGLVTTTRRGNTRELSFRSTLVVDVAARTLSDERLVELHARAAAFLGSSPDAPPEDIARHCDLAGKTADAASWYEKAALAADRRGDSRSVLRWSGRALELDAPSAGRWALWMARARALGFLGRRAEQAVELDEALQRSADSGERALVLIEQSALHASMGELQRGLERADAAVEEARAAGDAQTIALAHVRRAAGLLYAGRIADADATLAHAEGLRDALPPGTRALLAEWRGQVATALGDLSARRSAYVEAIREYRAAGDVRRAAGAECNLADSLNRFGAFADAEVQLRAALEACRRVGNRLMEGYALANLGYAVAAGGRVEEALGYLDDAAALARATGEARLAVAVDTYRCRARLSAGSSRATGDAGDIAAEALAAAEVAARVGLPALEVTALTLAAEAELARGSLEAALELSDRALLRRDALGSIEEDEAEVFLVRARALRAAGREPEAARVIERARARLADLARRIADPDWRVRFLGAVAAHRELLGGPAATQNAGLGS